MKILILNGSFRQNGNTARVLSLFENQLACKAQAKNIELEIETISLGKLGLEFCRGCRLCFNLGFDKCPNKDGMAELFEKMQNADGLILASPVYVDDMSGLTKNFIDRLCHQCHRPVFAGKTAFVLATTGRSSARKTLDNLKLSLQLWGYCVIGKQGFVAGTITPIEVLASSYINTISKSAEKFLVAVEQQKIRPPDFKALMIFQIQKIAMRKISNDGSLDLEYWRSNGWLERKTSFYYPHQASIIRVWLARATGKLISKIVL